MRNSALLFLTLFACSLTHILFGQDISDKDKISKNAVFVELAGTGFLYSLNYERVFRLSKLISTSIRIGTTPCISTNSYRGQGAQLLGLLNCIIGKKNFKFEIGLGVDNNFNFHSNITEKEYRKGTMYYGNQYASLVSPPYNLSLTSQISFRHELKKKWFYRISFIFSDLLGRSGYGELTHFYLPWGGFSFGKMF